MPNRDATGPNGQGAGSGWGSGDCISEKSQRQGQRFGRKGRRVQGNGQCKRIKGKGQGFGQGQGNRK